MTSTEWLRNPFEKHSKAADRHSKQLEMSSAERMGCGFNPEAAGG